MPIVISVVLFVMTAYVLFAALKSFSTRRIDHPFPEIFLILLSNFIMILLIVLLYAELYIYFGDVRGAEERIDYIYFSAITLATVGYGDLVPMEQSRMAAATQGILGIFILPAIAGEIIFILNRFFRMPL